MVEQARHIICTITVKDEPPALPKVVKSLYPRRFSSTFQQLRLAIIEIFLKNFYQIYKNKFAEVILHYG